MKIIRYYILLLFLLISSLSSAQDAVSILDKTADLFSSSNGLKARFTLQTRAERQGVAESFEGTLDMKGDKFVLQTPEMITWFDGKTQWSYVDRNDEVNVSNPSGEELQMTNPTLLLQQYKKNFTANKTGECTAPNGKSAYTIELIPLKKGDIQRVEILIEKLSGLPASITIESKNDVSNSIRISKIERGINQPDRFFVFNENDFPDVDIIDLR